MAWQQSQSDEHNHGDIAAELAFLLGWKRDSWVGATLPDGTGYCFVQVEKGEES
jgi:hypothetical protein